MAYLNGAFSGGDTFATVMSKLHDFCVTAGWTINLNSFPSLAVSKGTTFVNIAFNETVTVDDTLGSGNAHAPDFGISSYLSNAYPPSSDSNRITDLSFDPVFHNDLNGPYSQYWFFSGGDDDPPYIYMVIQKANGSYSCYMFGRIDKKGVDYDGGDFITGVNWHWNFQNNTGVPTNGFQGSGQGSDPMSGAHGWPGDGAAQYQLRLGDVLTSHPYTSNFGGAGGRPYANALVGMMFRGDQVATQLENWSQENLGWIGQVAWLGPSPINGATPLFEVPVFYNDAAQSRMISMGSYPNYRHCSMLGRVEAEEITFGSDNWIVFPMKRALPWNPEPFTAKTLTSAQYGHAFKVVT
jgi:hypothetical protein